MSETLILGRGGVNGAELGGGAFVFGVLDVDGWRRWRGHELTWAGLMVGLLIEL